MPPDDIVTFSIFEGQLMRTVIQNDDAITTGQR